MPGSTRAEVIPGPGPDRAELSPLLGPGDSFASDFAPLPGCSVDCSVVRSPRGEAPEGGRSSGGPRGSDGGLEGQEDLPIRAKLDQLRKWQIHMQEQLKAHQLEELLRLQKEQHRLLGMTSGGGDSEASGLSGSRGAPYGSPLNLHPVPAGPPGVQEGGPCGPLEVSRSSLRSPSGSSRPADQDPSGAGAPGGSERPLQVGVGGRRKRFEELLEEQLSVEEQRLKSARQQQSHAHPKRAFLKRGEGLSRLTTRGRASSPKGPGPGPTTLQARGMPRSHSELAAIQTATLHRGNLRGRQGQNTEPPESLQNTRTGALSAPGPTRSPTTRSPTTRSPTTRSPTRSPGPNAQQPDPVTRQVGGARGPEKAARDGESGCALSVEPRGGGGGGGGVLQESFESSFQDKLRLWETVELGEFELLEEAAEELSFSSNSSFVIKVLQMDRQHRALPPRRLSSTPIRRSGPAPPAGSEGSTCGADDLEEREAELPPHAFCFPPQADPPYDKRSYQDEEEEEEEEEEGGEESESTLNQDTVVFDDGDTWLEGAALGSANESGGPAGVALPPPTRTLSRKPKAQNAPLHPAEAPESRKSEETTGQQLQSRQLRERLVQLEVEIRRFQEEQEELSRLRQQNEEQQEVLRKERSAFERTRAEQLAQLEEHKKEAHRKLHKERQLLEQHAARARAIPDRKEREEIQVLKQQLGSLQEELRRKESRWTSSHGRLRQQVDSLGQENRALQDQVRVLEKLRLSTWRKSPPEDREPKDPRVCEGTATKAVKFASPLDSRGAGSPPHSRRSSQGGAAGRRSSLRRPSVPCLPPPSSSSSSSSSSSPGRRTFERNQDLDVSPVRDQHREPDSAEEVRPPPDGKVETLLAGGERLLVFSNGTQKEVSADGRTVKVTFFNGDTKEVTADRREIYFYAEAQTTHITFPDGVEVLHFPNNQTEKHFPDGRKEIVFPDQTVKNLFPGGREESVLPDGTVIQVSPDGTKEILFSTGQKEVHTAGYKRREYPDGTVKTVYADGRQETRYPNGRLRVKDRAGTVVLDSGA
ncbi:centromere protein J isoform X2 [Pseudoliparis swirei]|uniref:centromere protein J isoform X2 n=1 Tax=Pseudoliparis swirei TaxID=2059687 RepID=UPI0024BD93A0|nr:centromere protein J isoform X2 [Pseudoliparis swirei]